MATSATSEMKLLETAEALFGERGLDGVSLREIGVRAGAANRSAVQYYFKDIHGLVSAILSKRVPEVEVKRAALLAEMKSLGRLSDPRALMDVFYRPLLDHTDAHGERRYARFVLALLSSPMGLSYAGGPFRHMPLADHVLDLLHAVQPELPRLYLGERQRLVTFLVLNSVFKRMAPFDQDALDAALIDDVLDMATSAVLTPLSAGLRGRLATADKAQ
jgi:AcrR family transcriptional regulator